ncbi:hypothetical protein O9993_05210 [Vibrio lentus]|nr:hypothetical protein [Vibrio lentus]
MKWKPDKKILAEQVNTTTMSDMEDCSDPVLREFANSDWLDPLSSEFRLGACHNSLCINASAALWLVFSPVLDLSSSLDVAPFFATHKYTKLKVALSMNFIGNEYGKAKAYLIREDRKRNGAP